jgi:tripartite-type tricarboxylate transporter receptor subunit TctC
MKHFSKKAVLAVGLLAAAAGAWGQAFPSRAVTIVVPFPPGGSTDVVTRMVAKKMSDSTGQPVVIENKPGAGGVVGAVSVKNAPPDGYTLYVGHVGTHAVNVTLYDKLEYDPVKDFAPVSTFMSFPSFLVVPADSPAKTVAELVAFAKTKPAGLSFSSQGHGTAGHLLGEMLRTQTGTKFVHVPMKGAAPAVQEVAAGRVDFLFSSYISAGAFVRSGKLRILAVASPTRAKALPDVPTMAQAGFPGIEFEQWFGIFAPAGTPEAVVRKLSDEIAKAVRSPEVSDMLGNQAADVMLDSGDAFAKRIANDTARLAKVVRQLGAKVE